MATVHPIRRLTEVLSLTALLAAALTACGGNDDEDAPAPVAVAVPVFPTAAMGQVTALGIALFEPGTYTVSGCLPESSTTPLQRKIRFNADGSVEWLNAAAADAVLFSYTPSGSERDDRTLYYFRPDNWGANLVRYDASTGLVASYIRTSPTAVNVVYANNTVSENCAAAFNPTLRISSAIVAARVGSAVALNGTSGLSGGPLILDEVSFASINVNTAGAITTQTSEPGSGPVAWGHWLTTANTSNSTYYEERYSTVNAPGMASGTPANPTAYAYMRHPSLQGQRSGSAPGTLTSVAFGVARNTSGSGAPVGFYLSGN